MKCSMKGLFDIWKVHLLAHWSPLPQQRNLKEIGMPHTSTLIFNVKYADIWYMEVCFWQY